MKTLNGLIREAGKSARFRGHKLTKWIRPNAQIAGANCYDCGMGVQVNKRPVPNGIDIGGEAVALTCLGKPAGKWGILADEVA